MVTHLCSACCWRGAAALAAPLHSTLLSILSFCPPFLCTSEGVLCYVLSVAAAAAAGGGQYMVCWVQAASIVAGTVTAPWWPSQVTSTKQSWSSMCTASSRLVCRFQYTTSAALCFCKHCVSKQPGAPASGPHDVACTCMVRVCCKHLCTSVFWCTITGPTALSESCIVWLRCCMLRASV